MLSSRKLLLWSCFDLLEMSHQLFPQLSKKLGSTDKIAVTTLALPELSKLGAK
jgi:hypothetical protein